LLWYQEIDSYLRTLGFRHSIYDLNLYLSEQGVYLLLYVDDILLVAESLTAIEHVKTLLKDKYDMTDLGRATRFLSIEISQSPSSIALYQSHFVDTVLCRFQMQDCNPVQTPLEHGSQSYDTEDLVSAIDQKSYQSLVGSLMYLAIATRPD